MARITVKVDGVRYTDDVEPRTLLVQYLRERLGKIGTVIGCDTSNCGACTVHLDGRSVKSCSVLAVQADGHEVTTIEGLADRRRAAPGAEAFHENHALQCGFCTPGMIMQSIDLLAENPDPDRATRSAKGWRATCAAAPATRTSSGRPRPPPRERTAMTATEERPAACPQPEIGSARAAARRTRG